MSNNKIDFVIPCHPKDFPSLTLCINGIKNNISCLNKIFVISNENPTIDGIIHISESKYSEYLNKEMVINKFEMNNPTLQHRAKWIYQQFLKLYSGRIISELTESYVVVDADTIFLRDVSFDVNKFYYCITDEYHLPYLFPIKTLFNLDNTVGFSTICHHMIFNTVKLNEMLTYVEKKTGWNSFFEYVLNIIDYNEPSCFSEWDTYSNYMILNHPTMCVHRQLKWSSISFIPTKSHLNQLANKFDFVSCHAYIRGIE
jgi:hypothetical protein